MSGIPLFPQMMWSGYRCELVYGRPRQGNCVPIIFILIIEFGTLLVTKHHLTLNNVCLIENSDIIIAWYNCSLIEWNGNIHKKLTNQLSKMLTHRTLQILKPYQIANKKQTPARKPVLNNREFITLRLFSLL